MGRSDEFDDTSSLTGDLLGLDLEENDSVMTIGIDFGTTYSGVAWATASEFNKREINLITEWPDWPHEESKAPTQIYYEHDAIFWGYSVPRDSDPLAWFKLLLLKDEDLDQKIRSSEFIIRAKRKLRDENRSAVEVVADYLRALWGHTLEMIAKARGETILDGMSFHIVITVPAIWKGYARQSMRDAASKAGLLADRDAGKTRLSFVPEPEAAALASLSEPGFKVLPGGVYLICDAGGGTVDLITYRVSRVEPAIALDEAVEGIGGLCGGIFVDDAFERICKARMGTRWNYLSRNGIQEILKDEWEMGHKRHFKLQNASNEYIVSIPAEAFAKTGGFDDTSMEPHIKNGRIHFKGPDIQRAFEGSFSDIDKLIETQIQKATGNNTAVNGIILVGGLGSSRYLHQHLSDRYRKAGITVRSAICRGAIYKGFLDADRDDVSTQGLNIKSPISVSSTISRLSMGVRHTGFFDPSKHDAADRFWDSDEAAYKGEKISVGKPVRHNFYRIYSVNEFDGGLWEIFYQCGESSPPSVWSDGSVQRLCDLHTNTNIPSSALKDHTSADGKKTSKKKLEFDLEMVPSGASIEFGLYVGEKKQGSQAVKIEYE
ncbi:hypothetical protein BDW59DRAFT_167879 [Aspergillus cavernicola]|uniref:Actin-like ATPase domain-containing protein n=1 Tax=Aspergillus cavernicola TaxID=176166 RepID=A0ABR4HA75_9EURO